MADFDILEEVNSKFLGTVVLFDKKAALVKESAYTENGFVLFLQTQGSRSYTSVALNDPALNYKNYQIGYVNGGHYASWWYRKPHKQWKQGLQGNQMGWRVSGQNGQAHDNFGFTKPFINMLEGVYPDIEQAKKALIDKTMKALAFHKDFALSYDDIHDDFIIEYHAVKIGASLDRELKQFKIIPEARHLIEALQEARNVYA